jgi:NADH dehydrogenase
MTAPHVVILGGGFGGLNAAKALGNAPVRVTLVDRRNYHLFQPLLYQVAIGGLHPADIAYPIRAIVRKQRNSQVLLANVDGVDLAAKRVMTTEGDLQYDYLVVATGAETSYFGHSDWEERAPGLKSVEDALEVRRRVLSAFEKAECQADPAERARLLTFVVIGGGPTGVEMAGSIAELARRTLRRDFRSIDPAEARIVLIEGGPRILPTFAEDLAQSAVGSLQNLGVAIRTDTRVTDIEPGRVRLDGETLECATILWAAGVRACPLGKSLGVETDRGGRVVVAPDLTIPGHSEAFVVGDLANLAGPDGKPLPGVAPVAIQQGRHVARNIVAAVEGRSLQPFRYVDKGTMATIGRAAAIVQFPWGGKLSGLLAWFAWLVVHIMYLIGFRSRLFVLLQWTSAYLLFDLAARLITEARWPVSEPDTVRSADPASRR